MLKELRILLLGQKNLKYLLPNPLYKTLASPSPCLAGRGAVLSEAPRGLFPAIALTSQAKDHTWMLL